MIRLNKCSIYLFLLCLFSARIYATHQDVEPISESFFCFDDVSLKSLCWQQMLTESDTAVGYDFGVHYANGTGVKHDFMKGRY